MYGDTEAVRALARRMTSLGEEIREEARRLHAGIEAVPWRGMAAGAMRLTTAVHLDGLRRAADLHDDAATALIAHADEVDQRKAVIAAVEAAVTAAVEVMVSAAEERLGDLAGLVSRVLPDPVEDLLARFVPPPSGHRDWLDVDLPGLSGLSGLSELGR